MKRFLKKRWHSIPVGIVAVVMALVLVTGSALAAYNFTSLSVDVEVDEPLQVQYKLDYVVHDTQNPGGRTDTTGWLDLPSGSLSASFSAGDTQTLYLRMNNRANSPLTVNTVITGNTGRFDYTLSDFPNGVISASNGFDFGGNTVNDAYAAEWTSGGIPIGIKGDAPPAAYSLTFAFKRS